MKRLFGKYGFAVSLLLLSFELISQTTPPPPAPPPPPGLPIGTNVEVLLLATVIFGFCKIYISIFKKKRSF